METHPLRAEAVLEEYEIFGKEGQLGGLQNPGVRREVYSTIE